MATYISSIQDESVMISSEVELMWYPSQKRYWKLTVVGGGGVLFFSVVIIVKLPKDH